MNVIKNKQRKVTPTSKPRKRVTFTLPQALDQALEVYCSGTRQLKNEVATKAIQEYLGRHLGDLQQVFEATNNAIKEMYPP